MPFFTTVAIKGAVQHIRETADHSGRSTWKGVRTIHQFSGTEALSMCQTFQRGGVTSSPFWAGLNVRSFRT
jgi:hypothetical protein